MWLILFFTLVFFLFFNTNNTIKIANIDIKMKEIGVIIEYLSLVLLSLI